MVTIINKKTGYTENVTNELAKKIREDKFLFPKYNFSKVATPVTEKPEKAKKDTSKK